jgi:glycosyltransferase involved in cell wall biosynthesis
MASVKRTQTSSGLRVLFCTHEPLLPLSGGCTIGNLRLVQALARHGFKVSVLSPLNQCLSESQSVVGQGVILKPFQPWRMHRNIALRFPKYLLYSLFYFFALWRRCGEFRPDILLVRNAVLALPALAVARARGVKVVLSYTDLLSALLAGNPAFPRWLISLLRAFEVRVPAWFDRVIVISQRLKKELVQGGVDSGRIRVFLDGADTDLFDPRRFSRAQRAKTRLGLGVKPGEKLVVFHGTVEAHHGQTLVAQLVRQARRRHPRLKFVILGGGPGFEIMKQELSAVEGAQCLPFMPPSEVALYVVSADAGMVPYPPSAGLDLVFTLKLLEYFALGLPAVTFRLASAQEAFGSFRHLLVSNSEEDFVENLGKAVKLKPSLGLRRRILRDFSWDAVTRRFCGELGSMAGPAGSQIHGGARA